MAYVDDLTTPATGDVAMRRLKTHAVARGWIVMASGDGRSAYGPDGDPDPDVIDNDSGAGSLDASGAWYRLRMSGTTRELLVIRKASSTAWTIRYSVLGFVGGSPSATTAPTATDQQTWIDNTLLMADGTYRWLICAEDAAPFYLGATALPAIGGAPQTTVHLWPMRAGSYPTLETDPYVGMAYYNAGGVHTWGQLAANSSSSGSPGGWYRHGLSSSAWVTALLCYPAAQTVVVSTAGLHGASGEEMPIEIPVELLAPGSAQRGPKGYVRDARYCMTPAVTVPHGTHLTQGGRYWYRAGDLWLPWGATPPAL